MSTKRKISSEDIEEEAENTFKMSNIDKMSTEILEIIFSHLPRRQRIVCKEVCSRWYTILMESHLFRKDRHIFFRHEFVHPQAILMETIFKAIKPYEIFTFGATRDDGFWGDLDDLTPNVLQHIKEINFVKLSYENFPLKNFLQAPLLECLSFYDENYEENSNFKGKMSLESFARSNVKIRFRNLKTVKVTLDSSNPLHYQRDYLNPFKLMIPKEIMIEVHINNKAKVDEHCPIGLGLISSLSWISGQQTKFTVNHIKINFFHMTKKRIEKFLASNFTYKDFHLVHDRFEIHNYNLDEVLDKIKADEITLSTITELPQIPNNLHRIRKVVVDSRNQASVKWLEKMENLKELEFSYNIYFFNLNTCFFGHEAVRLENVEKVIIKFKTKKCQECLNALKQSFENLKELQISALSSFLLEISCWPKLENLTLDLEDFSLNLMTELGSNLKQFPDHTLQKLILKINYNIESWQRESITNSVKHIFPNLKEFVCNASDYVIQID